MAVALFIYLYDRRTGTYFCKNCNFTLLVVWYLFVVEGTIWSFYTPNMSCMTFPLPRNILRLLSEPPRHLCFLLRLLITFVSSSMP